VNILILVLSCHDNGIYSKFFETQKNTWDSINVEGIETFYFFGDHDKDEIIDNRILINLKETTKIESDGNLSVTNSGLKTLKSFEMIKNMDFDYVFRTNSSSYVDKKLLIDFINNKPKTKYYSGFIGNHGKITFASGSGFFLSKDLINLLIENKNRWDHSLIDDVSIAGLLKEFGVSPENNPRYDVYNENIPLDYFHYRIKTRNRNDDCKLMELIHNKKNELYNR
jgi:hypothetical protein